ncbi:MAG: PaaI family thioesterase [Actinomycetota bacterium]|nr:PaaI family thioesterase [Actinomycetota bacterium]
MTEPTDDLAPNAHRFAPLTPEQATRWNKFPETERVIFPVFIGLQVEEIRIDYGRMRLPYRPEYEQPAGVVHGGAIATLIDTVVVPAVGTGYDVPVAMLTLSMTLNFIGAVVGEDTVAEGWIERRGRATVFCRAEARTAKRGLVATASLVYTVRPVAGT